MNSVIIPCQMISLLFQKSTSDIQQLSLPREQLDQLRLIYGEMTWPLLGAVASSSIFGVPPDITTSSRGPLNDLHDSVLSLKTSWATRCLSGRRKKIRLRLPGPASSATTALTKIATAIHRAVRCCDAGMTGGISCR